MNEDKTQEGFEAGKILKEKYVIDDPIGDGGMGLIYLAHDINNARHRFVVKTLNRRALGNEYVVKHFRQEGEALGRINHDGVVKLFDHGEDDETGLPFLVIEFAEGITLSKIIKREPMSLEKCADLVRKIAYALTAVHKADVLHRDLKPDNIMVVESPYEQDKIKIIDFGVAIVRDSIHAATTIYEDKRIIGTPAYASPEQLKKSETTAGEVFTLAVIAYEMLTGMMAFPAASFESTLDLHPRGVREKPSVLRKELSTQVDEVMAKGLAMNADERYQTPIEFADALAAALKAPASAPPKSLLKKLAAGAAMLLLLTIASLGYYFWNSGNQPKPVANATPPIPEKTNPATAKVFSYFFKIQKMQDNLPSGEAFLSADSNRIADGDKFELNVNVEQEGNFYLAEETAGSLKLLFPVGGANRRANPKYWTVRNREKNQKFWLVWSKNPVNEIETQAAGMREFLEKNFDRRAFETKAESDGIKVSGAQDLVVYRLSFD